MPRKIKVKSAEDVSKKWGDVAPGKSSYYEAEASVAGSTWENNAVAAEKTFKAALSEAGIEKRFSGGIKRVGGSKYERKVRDVGVSRYGPGITAAVEDMKSGIAPYLEELAKIDLPDRGPRGSMTNYALVQKVGDPLHKRRLVILGATAGS